MPRFLRRLSYRILSIMSNFLGGDRQWGSYRLFVTALVMVLPPILIAIFTAVREPLIGQSTLFRFLDLVLSWTSLRWVFMSLFATSVAIIMGGRYIQDIYELKDYRIALNYLFASIYSIGYSMLHVHDGKKETIPDEVNTLDKIGGPGWVLISPGNAILLERLNHPSNVRAAGLHFVSRFETIKEILDLKDQHYRADSFTAISKDGLIVTIHDFQFRYRLWGIHKDGGITGRNPVNPYPYSTQAVRNMVYNRSMRALAGSEEKPTIPTWEQTVQLAVDGEVQGYIRRNMVDAIISPDPGSNPREEIRQAIMASNVRGSLRNIGAHLIWVDIGYFTVDDPVEEQNILTWGAKWSGEADLFRARGDAARQAVIEQARADAQADLLIKIAEALSELDDEVRYEDRQRMTRLFLLKVMQVLDELRRPNNLPASTDEDKYKDNGDKPYDLYKK